MKKLFNAALVYMVLGVGSGLFYREFTKLNDFPEGQFTQLGLAHTHLLTLGFIVLLIVLVVEKAFRISASPRLFAWFFWLYNAGVGVTSAMLIWHGTLTVLGKESSAMISGIAGLGHISITAGMIVFFIALRRAIFHSPAQPAIVESTTQA
ncbi:DUF2871 domain-containing protein [Microbacterium mitrae]|uniref:DUF2871 domain-containing protein n=1 Tax=Microbacterium mitrae TaxID=664640 RepID=A0A5C8HMH6_9MICO|nr:DUF2871 domain-containing protein [Microbacterium mitrae]TXK04728.1 DUF2871 domain-containing protein [Microbacterium mitrae]